MADSQVIRITMFKMPRLEDREKMVAFYEKLKLEQKKDGKPYIISLEAGPVAGPVFDDARSKGITFVSKTIFKNMADHAFYDEECEAHKTLKASVIGERIQVDELMTLFYKPTVKSYL